LFFEIGEQPYSNSEAKEKGTRDEGRTTDRAFEQLFSPAEQASLLIALSDDRRDIWKLKYEI
jgi:hypothetical protein